MLPTIFQLFTQLEHRTGGSQGGLGIGLALVRRLVEMHGGSVTAHSDGPGCGSEFAIQLPLSVERTEAVTEGANEGPAIAQDSALRRRILVADDNADALESLATLLALRGHEVYRAADGLSALESAQRYQPEIALLDIGMPQLDGYEVARRIRASPWRESMQLVALTGWGQESDRQRSRESGFNNHLTKPVDHELLTRLPDQHFPNAPPSVKSHELRGSSPAESSSAIADTTRDA